MINFDLVFGHQSFFWAIELAVAQGKNVPMIFILILWIGSDPHRVTSNDK